MPPRPVVTVLLTTAMLLAVAGQASAHPRTASATGPAVSDGSDVTAPAAPGRPAVSIEAAATGRPAGWLVLPALTLAAVAGRRLGSRRLHALVLIAIVGFMSFETGVHSVHHLGEVDDADCAVATATVQLDATMRAEPVVAVAGAGASLVHAGAPVALDRRGERLEQQRAPPA